MNFKTLFIGVLLLLLGLSSCRKDLDFEPSSEPLGFSRDTVFLDTVFNTIRSESYSVKVYNRQNEDVVIPKIYLAEGNNSMFKINIDGEAAYEAFNTPIRANDSIYIIVEIAPEINNSPDALVEEFLKFETMAGTQEVTLLCLVEDADFFFNTDGSPTEITSNTNWNNDKSKVIYGDLIIKDGASLNIEPGTRVYFHKNSGMIVDENCNLTVNGSMQEPVVIRGDRSDLRYDTLPANWNSIRLLDNSTATINHAKIKGGNVGLEMYNASLNISNSEMKSFVNAAIFANNSTIDGYNLLLNNVGETDLALVNGGDYDFNHCTFSNYFYLNFGNQYSLYMTNFYEDEFGNYTTNDLNANFGNSIFYNDGISSMLLVDNGLNAFNDTFTNCLVRYGSSFDPTQDPSFVNCIYNENPLFTKPNAYSNNLTPMSGSIVFGNASAVIAAQFPTDYFGINRNTNSPTIGAIEF